MACGQLQTNAATKTMPNPDEALRRERSDPPCYLVCVLGGSPDLTRDGGFAKPREVDQRRRRERTQAFGQRQQGQRRLSPAVTPDELLGRAFPDLER